MQQAWVIVIFYLFAICTNGPTQKIPAHSQHRELSLPPGPVFSVYSLSLVAGNWNVVGLFCCGLCLWQVALFPECGLQGVSSYLLDTCRHVAFWWQELPECFAFKTGTQWQLFPKAETSSASPTKGRSTPSVGYLGNFPVWASNNFIS